MKILMTAAASVLLLAACSPAAEQSSAPTVQMSETARTQMAQVNEARFTMQMPASLADVPAVPESAVENPALPAAATPGAPAPAGETPTEATVAQNVTYDAGMARIQVLLDRAHFSPGVIDGYDGENVRKAVSAYQEATNLPVNGLADDTLLTRLEQTIHHQPWSLMCSPLKTWPVRSWMCRKICKRCLGSNGSDMKAPPKRWPRNSTWMKTCCAR